MVKRGRPRKYPIQDEVKEPRKCTECGAEFIPKTKANKVCGKKCARTRNIRLDQEKRSAKETWDWELVEVSRKEALENRSDAIRVEGKFYIWKKKEEIRNALLSN